MLQPLAILKPSIAWATSRQSPSGLTHEALLGLGTKSYWTYSRDSTGCISESMLQRLAQRQDLCRISIASQWHSVITATLSLVDFDVYHSLCAVWHPCAAIPAHNITPVLRDGLRARAPMPGHKSKIQRPRCRRRHSRSKRGLHCPASPTRGN